MVRTGGAARIGLEPGLGIAGAVLLAASSVLAVLGVRPFATHGYEFAWWSAIPLLDGLVWLRRRRSPIAEAPLRFLLLALWSVGFWFVFELMNLRVRNWYYIFVAPAPLAQWIGTFVAFATVLPAIELAAGWVDSLLPVRMAPPGPRRRAPRWLPPSIAVLGLSWLVLSLIWPR
jgi:hypothetical protein